MKKIIFLLGFSTIFLSGCAKTYEGRINFYIEDCFKQITVEQNDSSIKFRDFICEYDKNSENKIYGGECYSFDIKNGKCTKGYVYEVKPQFTCPEETEINYSGECKCVDKDLILVNGRCIKDMCKEQDINTSYDIDTKKCVCTYCVIFGGGLDQSGKCMNKNECNKLIIENAPKSLYAN